jgi:CDP-glucose 4,6-dehydratase
VVRVEQPVHGPHEAGLLQLNCDKARQFLGWQAVWGFETAVGETVRWYRETADGHPAREVSRRQIAQYLEDARQ